MMANGKAGHLLNHADAAVLSDLNVSTPVVEQFKRALVFLTYRNGFLNAVTHYSVLPRRRHIKGMVGSLRI
jgi:hypothetical protein